MEELLSNVGRCEEDCRELPICAEKGLEKGKNGCKHGGSVV